MKKETAALTVIERAALALGTSERESKLRSLVEQSLFITEIKNGAARDQCHGALMTLRATRTDITKAGKEARDDANAFSKAVIAEEKRLVALIEPEEARLQGLRDEWDAAREAERRAKAEAEARRIAAIREHIDDIRAIATKAGGLVSWLIAVEIEDLEALQIDTERFAEMTGDAELARGETIDKLRQMYAAALAQEAEAKRLAEERAEIERQRAELAEQQRRDAEARAEQERKEAAARAEQERAERARREAEEAQRREELRKADEAMRAERQAHEKRMAAERAELMRQQEEAAAEQRRAAAELQRQQDELAAQRRAEADAAAARQREEQLAAAREARKQAERAEAERLAREAADTALRNAAPALLDACRQFVHASETSDADELENAYQAAIAAIAAATQTEAQPA